MNITLYKNSSDKKVLNKSITQVAALTGCRIFGECSIVDPVFILAYSADNLTANYCYVPEYNRYYYIKSIDILDGRRIRLNCHVDVLMSNAAAIKAITCTVARQSGVFNQYLDDAKFQTLNYQKIVTRNVSGTPFVPSGLTAQSSCFVLTVAGGDAT